MGNSTYKCYRTLHSRSQHQVVFELKQDVHDEQDDVEADVMARWKHEVYKMTLLEGAYVDSDTKKLSVCYGYRTLCSATLQDRLLTIVFCCSKWQELVGHDTGALARETLRLSLGCRRDRLHRSHCPVYLPMACQEVNLTRFSGR